MKNLWHIRLSIGTTIIGIATIFAFAFPRHILAATIECTDEDASYVCECTTDAGTTKTSVITHAQGCNDYCYDLNKGKGSYKLSCSEWLAYGYHYGDVSQGNVSPPASVLEGALAEEAQGFLVPILNVRIPGFTGFTTPTKSPDGTVVSVNFLAEYINALYGWALAAGALVAVVMLMLGGLQYVLSRGKSKYIEKAKTRITNAITGLVLLLAAYEIAFLIDPATTILGSLDVQNVAEIEASISEQGGEEESSSITPNDFPIETVRIEGDHIVVASGNEVADKEVVTALIAASETFYNATGENISVTDGARTLRGQATEFYDNCLAKGGVCSPVTCNPTSTDVVKKSGGKYVLVGEYAELKTPEEIITTMVDHAKASSCPHTSAVAIDAWGGPRIGKFRNDIELQQKLITAMISAGFCRLSKEVWHFELEKKKVSTSGCSQSWNSTSYIRKDTGAQITPDSSCRVWNFTEHTCAIEKG